jgi:hypothetical protein
LEALLGTPLIDRMFPRLGTTTLRLHL